VSAKIEKIEKDIQVIGNDFKENEKKIERDQYISKKQDELKSLKREHESIVKNIRRRSSSIH
jgi:hypothetical protein